MKGGVLYEFASKDAKYNQETGEKGSPLTNQSQLSS